jgi:uncharacterized membrane protein
MGNRGIVTTVMDLFQIIRLVHIVSASILFGTGIGIAFFMLKAHVSRNANAMAFTTSNVVLADWIFTTPTVIIQALSGLWLTLRLSIPLNSVWFISVVSLFAIVGLCWIPVVRIQIRIRNIIANGGQLDDYRSLMRTWVALGIPAFLCVMALYFLMVTKIGLGSYVFT